MSQDINPNKNNNPWGPGSRGYVMKVDEDTIAKRKEIQRGGTTASKVHDAMYRALDNYGGAPKSEKEPRMAQAANEAKKNDAKIRAEQAKYNKKRKK